MPDRIPLLSGPETPLFCEIALSVFGDNSYREPNFRLIWSDRKQIWFAGEVAPEYLYLPHPCWVLETWTPPEKDAGARAAWTEMQEAFMGPWPQWGTYNYVKHFPEDWTPSEENIRLLAKGVQESQHVEIEERKRAIRENLEAKANMARKEVADEIVESFGSAEFGKTTQAISGRPNVFRTADDHARDRDRGTPGPALPRSGGKLIN